VEVKTDTFYLRELPKTPTTGTMSQILYYATLLLWKYRDSNILSYQIEESKLIFYKPAFGKEIDQ